MYEVGLDLRIKSGQIIFSYRAKDYVIRSHPYEPCTYICQDEEVLHTLHSGFETCEIEKMILKDKQFRSVDSKMIGRDSLLQILAATIDDGRPELDFGYAERLGEMRQDDQQAYQQHLTKRHRKDIVMNQTMKQYIYRGEARRDFYLAFTQAHELGEFHNRIGPEENEEPTTPMGVIIVPKDYESSWITEKPYFLDWKIVVAPVSSQSVKGFNDPHWKVLKDNTSAELSGSKYVVFQTPEGKIVATTWLTELHIADSLEEYLAMPTEKVESMCYCSEMGRSR